MLNPINNNTPINRVAENNKLTEAINKLKAQNKELLSPDKSQPQQSNTDNLNNKANYVASKDYSLQKGDRYFKSRLNNQISQKNLELFNNADNVQESAYALDNFISNLSKNKFDINKDSVNNFPEINKLRAQFEINFEVVSYIGEFNALDGSGFIDYERFSFSLDFDVDFLNASEKESFKKPFIDDNIKNPDDLLKKIGEYFTPEKTAERIVDFASSFFTKSKEFKAEGNTEEARKKFSDTMNTAISKGFEQARGFLGNLPDDITSSIDKTKELTDKGINDFVKNGLSPDKSLVYDNLQSFNLSLQMSYQRTTSNILYNSSGNISNKPLTYEKTNIINSEA